MLYNKQHYTFTWVYYSLFTLLVIWSLWSLPYSPIAWFDEVFFASATHSLISGNGLALELDHFEPCVTYGPIYFLLTGAITKLFGFGIFQFRFVNCFFSFIAVFLMGKILDKHKVKKELNYLFQLMLLTDSLFIANSHSGRMELVALSFVLIAYLFFLDKYKSVETRTLVMSIMLSLAVMTTPRVTIICIPIALMQLIKLMRSHSWSLLMAYCLIPVALYSVWVFWAFGSYSEMIIHYTQKQTSGAFQQSSVERFIGGNWKIAKYHYPMIFAMLLALFYMIKKRQFENIIIYVAPILLFYLLVFDTGMYRALILPFSIILISLCASGLRYYSKKAMFVSYLIIVGSCLFINGIMYGLKAVSVMTSIDARNPQAVSQWFKRKIPEGSKVAGDYAYYYASIDNKCSFKRIIREGVDNAIVFNDLMNNFKPEYIVLSYEIDNLRHKPEFSVFDVEEISSYVIPENMLTKKLQGVVRVKFASSYNGHIYKIINKENDK